MAARVFRQVRAVTVGITELNRVYSRFVDEGWTLIESQADIDGRSVRLVLGTDEPRTRF